MDATPILTNSELMKRFTPKMKFEVFSIVTGKPISTPMAWDETWDEFDRMNGTTSNSMDVREASK